jgi:hypothetical protein
MKKLEVGAKKEGSVIASRTANSSTNNVVGDRNQKNAKEKDC